MKPKYMLTCLLPALGLLAGTPATRADGLVQVAPHRASFVGDADAAQTPPLFGYLARPDGPGPSPAAVVLPSCVGIAPHEIAAAATLKSWGYVVLVPDVLGGGDSCKQPAIGATAAKTDAYTALHYLSTQPFVDSARVALVGYSMGAWAALKDVEQGALQSGQAEHFRAAVTYYPWCGDSNGVMTIPVEILIGGADDWTPADMCKKMAAHESDNSVQRPTEGGVPVNVVVYPEATHAFDFMLPDRTNGGHRLHYDETATKDAETQMHAFLQQTLGGGE